MQDVAHHLQVYAHNHSGPERDAFARSAFNRYYYACFLVLRAALTEMNDDWKATPHKSYPEILSGSVTKKLKEERRKATKGGDSQLVELIDTALRAIPSISKTIILANGARKVADYEPEVPVTFEKTGRFSINSIDVSKAHEWHGQIVLLIESVLRAWRQIDA